MKSASDMENPTASEVESLRTPILIVGAGPVGMLLAYSLAAYHDQPCMLIEQNHDTTIYPKMEFTNPRSMEIYRALGLASQLRKLGVPEEVPFDELIVTGLGDRGHLVQTWKRDSPTEVRRKTAELNDGTGPLEPYLRCHQIAIEKFLKELVQENEKITSRWGWRFVSLTEGEHCVISQLEDAEGRKITVESDYVVGCDGAGSSVRRAIQRDPERTDLNFNAVFVHFRSSDTNILESLGPFWHCMTVNGAILVDQGNHVWTLHFAVPPGADIDDFKRDPERLVSEALGGLTGAVPVEISEIIVTGHWGSQVAVADAYRSSQGGVLLAGDAAHTMSPAGGHGLNTGVGDVWDLSWKLAATMNGWGGPRLLDSYGPERRPVAESNLSNVAKAFTDILLPMLASGDDPKSVYLTEDGPAGEEARRRLADTIAEGHWLHNQMRNILGYQYTASPIVIHEKDRVRPVSSITDYIPTTWPGARAPHVFLKDGQTSVFDLFGKHFNVIDFTPTGSIANAFAFEAKNRGIPLRIIHLPDEENVRAVWERDVVLVRPDGHVAWRMPRDGFENIDQQEIRGILDCVAGKI